MNLASHISDVTTPWSLTAFAIAALLALYTAFSKRPTANTKRELRFVAILICIVAALPLVLNTLKNDPIYRVRVTTLDSRGIAVQGASVHITASHEAKTSSADGSCELAVPNASLPNDKTVTILADKDNLHGKHQIQLASDLNPSIIVTLLPDTSAGFTGSVQDDHHRAISGARISAPGAITATSNADGVFVVQPFATLGDNIKLHVEKPGYMPIDEYHAAGPVPVSIVLSPETVSRPRSQKPRQ